MKADREAMEANPEEIESESEHPEVPKEEAAVKIFGALKNVSETGSDSIIRRRARHLLRWVQ
jgi:hypothetical protein